MIVTKTVHAILFQVVQEICGNNMSMHIKNISVTHPSQSLFYSSHCAKRKNFERPVIFKYWEMQKSLLNMVNVHGRGLCSLCCGLKLLDNIRDQTRYLLPLPSHQNKFFL